VVLLYLSEGLDYPLFIHSILISLKLNSDFTLLSLAFGISFEYLSFPLLVTSLGENLGHTYVPPSQVRPLLFEFKDKRHYLEFYLKKRMPKLFAPSFAQQITKLSNPGHLTRR